VSANAATTSRPLSITTEYRTGTKWYDGMSFMRLQYAFICWPCHEFVLLQQGFCPLLPRTYKSLVAHLCSPDISLCRPHLDLAALLGRLCIIRVGPWEAATHAMIRYPVLLPQNGQKVGVELQSGSPRTPNLSHGMQLINRSCTGHRDAKTMLKDGKHPLAMRLGCGQG
jgi:hypothetical protein